MARTSCLVMQGILAWVVSVAGILGTAETAGALDRAGQATILDAANGTVYLFAGRDRDQRVTSDVYSLRLDDAPATWHLLKPLGERPEPRELSAGAYCAARQEFVSFGGCAPPRGVGLIARDARPRLLGDTWRLELGPHPRFERLNTNGAPAPRFAHSMVYDATKDRYLLFGGVDSTMQPTNETWELKLDPEPVWRKLAFEGRVPSERAGHMAVFDARHRQMVVFGAGTADHDVWMLSDADEHSWKPCTVANDALAIVDRTFAGAGYDSLNNGVWVFGGFFDSEHLCPPDLWQLSLGAVNEGPGRPYSPVCYAYKMTNYGPGDTPLDIRPAPDSRGHATLFSLPRRPQLNPGDAQPMLLLLGGSSRADQPGWSMSGTVNDDAWTLVESRPAAGGYWSRDWRPMTTTAELPLTLVRFVQQRWDSTGYGSAPFLLADVRTMATAGGQATFYAYSNELGTGTSHASQANYVFVQMPTGKCYEAPLGGVNTRVVAGDVAPGS